MPNERSKAEQLALELVDEVRAFCLSQVLLWQKVPYLALEAQGKGGFLDDLYFCLETGTWLLTNPALGGNRVICGVDCATGELINPYATEHFQRLELARAQEILLLCTQLQDLDAEVVIAKLTERAKRPLSGNSDDFLEWQEQTERYRRKWGLHPDQPFIRPPWPGDAVSA